MPTSFSPTGCPPGSPSNGFLVEVFEFNSLGSLPDFTGLTPDSTLVIGELDFSSTSSAWPGFDVVDNYAVLATTILIIESPGSYKFYLASDDGSLLFIDGSLVVDNGGLHSFKEKSASIDLDPGMYAIEVNAVVIGV